MSMISQKQDAIWISNPEAQGGAENDWVEYQGEIDAQLDSVQVLAGSNSADLVCWDDEVTNGQDFVIRQDGTPYQSIANVTSSQEVLVNTIHGINNITLDGTNLNINGIEGFRFSSDGTKLYNVEDYSPGGDNNRASILQYTVSTPWDITTASFSGKYYYLKEDHGGYFSLAFKPDGTKLYINGAESINGGGIYYQYSLTTAWDITTAVYDTVSLDIDQIYSNATTNDIFDIYTKPDGTKFYFRSKNNHTVFSFTLSTPWDLSTATFDNSISPVLTSSYIFSFHIDTSGSYLYTLESNGLQNNSTFKKFEITTPWDVSTIDVNFVTSEVISERIDYFVIDDNDSNLYTNVNNNGGYRQYTLPTDQLIYRTENTINLTDFGLAATPQYVFTGFPEMKVCLEDTALRCISRDTPMTIQAVNTDQVQVTYSDTLDQTLTANDLVVIDSGDVSVTSVVDSGTTTAGGDKIWNVNLPLSGTTPTFIHIKDRSDLMAYPTTLVAGNVYSYSVSVSTTGAMSHTFPSQDIRSNPKRAVQMAVIGDEGTTVTNLTTNLWKT